MRWVSRIYLQLLLLLIASFAAASRRQELREEVRELFYHGFNSYMDFAFPEDELQPLSCRGRGSDKINPGNIGINDVCGDFALTLIDTLDMLPILGDQAGFERAVRDVIDTVTFDVDSKVQIFEATIRLLGGLLSAHQYASDKRLNSSIAWYDNELLNLALDLGNRLLPAFDSPTGIPYPRINLKYGLAGLPNGETTETCAAGAASLVLEFAALSRLSGLPIYEKVAITAFKAIWERRLELGLVGNTIDAQTGAWTSSFTGVGAGIDSFYEYALKAWVMLDDNYFYAVWAESQAAIAAHIADEQKFLYRTIHVRTGFVISNNIDSLSAYYAGLLVLGGHIDQAIKSHLVYHGLWTRYRSLPERYNFISRQPDIVWYPLRPEFVESTYFLYRATRDPFYLAVGEQILNDLKLLRQQCGFASLGNVVTRSLDDRMESFMLSETLKYLFLLFDEKNHLNQLSSNWVFTTEGHPLFIERTKQEPTPCSVPLGSSCEVPDAPGFFSAVLSRTDLGHAYHIAGLNWTLSELPSYFPPSNPRTISKVIHVNMEFEVLFGQVAQNILNVTSNFVQRGTNLMIKTLLGLKIGFTRVNNKFLASRVGPLDCTNLDILISDPKYAEYSTEGLVKFSAENNVVLTFFASNTTQAPTVNGVISKYGTPLPISDMTLTLHSLLNTSNSNGCSCPALLRDRNIPAADDVAILVFRGGCSFFEKSANAWGAAGLVIVVDPESEAIRPALIDDEGVPMPSNGSYPSLLMVPASALNVMQDGNQVTVRSSDLTRQVERLVIRGEVVDNVRVDLNLHSLKVETQYYMT